MLFLHSFFVNELAFFMSTIFLPRLPCVSEVHIAFAIGLCSLGTVAMFVILTDIFVTDVSCEILQPTSYTISRRHGFRQVLDAHV